MSLSFNPYLGGKGWLICRMWGWVLGISLPQHGKLVQAGAGKFFANFNKEKDSSTVFLDSYMSFATSLSSFYLTLHFIELSISSLFTFEQFHILKFPSTSLKERLFKGFFFLLIRLFHFCSSSSFDQMNMS